MDDKRNIFIIGSKGIPGKYGGYETFVDKLTEYHQMNSRLVYHVACKGRQGGEQYYHKARCFYVKVPDIGRHRQYTMMWRLCMRVLSI